MKCFSWISSICMVLAASLTMSFAGMIPAKSAEQAQAQSAYAKLPMCFEANMGQTDKSVKFLARGKGYTLFLTASEAVLAGGLDVVRLKLEGANAASIVKGMNILPSQSNYLTGNGPNKWQTGVKQYSRVEYKQVYPGIDMAYYGNQGQLEYDFIVAPGANPGLIRINFDGTKNIKLDAQGNLVLSFKEGQMSFSAPILYQKTGSTRVPVEGRFVLAANKQVSFEVGAYDKNKELVIDPSLTYSTYLGTTVEDRVNAIVTDAAGNVYMTGQTQTVADKFPGTASSPIQASNNGGAFDAFVIKLNPAGAIVWATYYGGVADDIGLGIGLDGTGKVYISGSTTGSLPVPYTQLGTGGGTDAFVAAFSADGTALVYARQFGCPQVDTGDGIAVDTAGNAYVTGFTGSTADNSFPVNFAGGAMYGLGSAQTSFGGAGDAFVVKLNAAGVLMYSTYLGGTGIDFGKAIAIDSLGAAYVVGGCGDAFVSVFTYPNVFKNTANNIVDGFLAKLDPTGATFTYKTYVGGANSDEATALAVTSPDTVYITGWTDSADFPDTAIAFAPVGQLTNAGAPDAFVFKLHLFQPGGGHNDGVFSTFLGGNGIDRAAAIKVDSAGNSYVTGVTESPNFVSVGPGTQPSLPYTAAALGGGSDAFVTVISPDGLNPRLFNTYLGGVTLEGGMGISLDAGNNIYVAGWTTSAGVYPTGFPTALPLYADNTGAKDGFVMKFSPVSAAPIPSITKVNPVFGPTAGSTTTIMINGSEFNGINGPDGVKFGTVNAVSYVVNSSTWITAIAPAHAAGTVDIVVTGPAGASFAVATDTYTYYDLPNITGVIPPGGVLAGGTTVVITGSGFTGVTGATGVKFDVLNAASYVVNSSTQITAITPPHASGIVHITARNPVGSSTIGLNDIYTYVLATSSPVITLVNPASGLLTGGTTVVITGSGFTGINAPNGIKFGAVNAASYVVDSSTQITAMSPAHAVGLVDIVATSLNGVSAVVPEDNYTFFAATPVVHAPIITSVAPPGGLLTGGTTVVITGSWFTGITGANGVKFGLINAAGYAVNSDTQITALSPAHAVGLVDVTATSLDGTSAIVPEDAYTYFVAASSAAAPVITGVSPAGGVLTGGTTVVITGTGFSAITGPNGIKFDITNARSYTVNSNTQITAISPAHAVGIVNIVATSTAGLSAIGTADNYTYFIASSTPAPAVSILSPTFGPAAGGTTVVITGTGFTGVTGANGVKFGELNATSYTVNSNTQITAVSPAHAAGVVDIVTTGLYGSSAIVPEGAYTYFVAGSTPAPTITSLSPILGSSLGDTTVVITGTGFTGITAANGVKFGELSAASYVVNSDTKITARTRAHATGIVDVVVTSLSGASATGAASRYTYFLVPVVGATFDPYIFPSPVTGDTAGIGYWMAGPGLVNIRVYSEIGKLAATLEENKPAGTQGSSINVRDLAPGVYLYLLRITYDDGNIENHSKRKFVVVR